MAPINSLLFLLFIPLILNLPIATASIVDKNEQKQLLTIDNDAENIFLEISLRNKKCDNDKGLLICYPSVLLKHPGNAKASRRFQLIENGAEKFGQCRNLTDDPHNGILINFQDNHLMIETSFGANFFCLMEGKKTFRIQLRRGASLLSTLKGCGDQSPCEAVNSFGELFNQTIRNGMVPYMDDFGPLWNLRLDMLAPNISKKSQITYYPPCRSWTLKIADATKALTCDPTTNITTKPTTNITTKEATTKKPLGLKDLKKPNKTKPGHEFQFGIDMLWLACDHARIKEEQAQHHKQLMHGPPENVVEFEKETKLIDNRGCFGPFTAKQSDSSDCDHQNSAIITVCYDGLLDPEQNVGPRFELSNLRYNEIAAFCQQHQSTDSADAKIVRHGFRIGGCSKRVEYKKEAEAKFAIKYKVEFNVSLSYSEKIYSYAMDIWVPGDIGPDQFHNWDEATKSFQTLTIHIANGTSLFATLVDVEGKAHNFAENIEAVLGTEDGVTKFGQIAEGDDALGLLGRDLIPQHENDSDWNRTLQIFSPTELCNNLKFKIDGEEAVTRLSCYKRGINLCDQMGLKDFDEMIRKNHELLRLKNDCRCEYQKIPTLPPEIENITAPPTSKPLRPHPMRRKRSLNDEIPDDDGGLVPGCEDVRERMSPFQNVLRYLPDVDKDIEEQKKCCPNETNNNIDANHQRPKRQMTRSNGLWRTPIANRFAPDNMVYHAQYRLKLVLRFLAETWHGTLDTNF